MSKKRRTALVLAAVVAAGTLLCARSPGPLYRTAPVEQGDLAMEVTASGTVNPHALVAVGTQVSGTIARIFVDYNERVAKGQLIALIDTTLLHAAILDAEASMIKARAQETLTRRNLERVSGLFAKGLAPQADVDQAEADYQIAQASTGSVAAQLHRAKINRAYAAIRSPITGVVVNRAVDVGQTVAASFNTPTLFTIANDLTRMQVLASIDEADIGRVEEGQSAQFTVDAYPEKTFGGTVTQKRLQPVTAQNVVTYTVVIDVENADLLLMPGMTANSTIVTQVEKGVIKIPAAALKFRPQERGRKKDAAARVQAADAPAKREKKTDSATVYVLDKGKPRPVRVAQGAVYGSYAAVDGPLSTNDRVIVGVQAPVKKGAAQQQSPLGGMPRRL